MFGKHCCRKALFPEGDVKVTAQIRKLVFLPRAADPNRKQSKTKQKELRLRDV